MSRTTGPGLIRTSAPYSARICAQSVSSKVGASAWQAAIAACSQYGPGPAEPSRPLEQRAGLGDRGVVPAGAVLVAEQHERAAIVEARRPARLVEAHQREQGEHLGLLRQHPRDQPAEPEGVDAEVAARRDVGAAAEVALVEDDVERGEHLGEPIGQLVRAGHPVRDVRADDLALGAHDALRHGRLGYQKRMRDLARGHAHDRAERQRHLGVAGERRDGSR